VSTFLVPLSVWPVMPHIWHYMVLQDVVTECDAFDVEKFIPLLKERIRLKDPFIRQVPCRACFIRCASRA